MLKESAKEIFLKKNHPRGHKLLLLLCVCVKDKINNFIKTNQNYVQGDKEIGEKFLIRAVDEHKLFVNIESGGQNDITALPGRKISQIFVGIVDL